MNNVKNTLQTTIIKNNNVKQLVLGSAAGYATGYVTMEIGKRVAFVAGGGIILFQAAQNHGLTKMDWNEARAKAKSMTQRYEARANEWKNKAKSYAKNNKSASSSFVGGFLIGAASANTKYSLSLF